MVSIQLCGLGWFDIFDHFTGRIRSHLAFSYVYFIPAACKMWYNFYSIVDFFFVYVCCYFHRAVIRWVMSYFYHQSDNLKGFSWSRIGDCSHFTFAIVKTKPRLAFSQLKRRKVTNNTNDTLLRIRIYVLQKYLVFLFDCIFFLLLRSTVIS